MLKLNVLYNAVYLSRSIRPNKYPKIEFEIESKVRHSLLYIPLPFERQIQTSLRTWLCVLGISKCRRWRADRAWLFLSADAKVQTLALSLSSLDYAHISSSATFKFWNWTFASSKTQSNKPEVTLLSKNDEGKIVIVLN